MGAGGGGGSSKPEHTRRQKMLLEWGEGAIIPLAEGKETLLTRRLEQQAGDITESQRQASSQNIMNVAGTTGMGASQVAGLLSQSEDTAIQAGFKNIMGARMSLANKAMDMISGVPTGPGQTSQGATTSKGQGAMAGAATGATAGAAFGPWGAVIGGVAGAAGGYASSG